MRIGVMSAMREEIGGLVAELGPRAEAHAAGMRTYHVGELWGRPAALVFSRWGKVAAATTATILITHGAIDRLLFLGVAGGADPALGVGDVVVGSQLYQHDMDSRPLFPRHEIPLLGVKAFSTDPTMRQALLAAARAFLDQDLPAQLSPAVRAAFHIERPRAVAGDIASGDRFFAGRAQVAQLKQELPDVCCVEMEGAAVAQVCHEYGMPFAIARIISDAADERAAVDFPAFTRQVASVYSHGILRRFLGDPATA